MKSINFTISYFGRADVIAQLSLTILGLFLALMAGFASSIPFLHPYVVLISGLIGVMVLLFVVWPKVKVNLTLAIVLYSTVFWVSIFSNLFLMKFGFSIGYLFEMILFSFVPFLVFRSIVLNETIVEWTILLRVLVLIFLLYWLLALVSTIFGRSHLYAALWQIMYNLKLPLMIMLGAYLGFNHSLQDSFKKIFFCFVFVVVPFLFVEYAFPSLTTSIIGNSTIVHTNTLLGGFVRAFRGPFAHSGYFSIFAGLGLIYCVFSPDLKRMQRITYSLVYFIFLLLAGQRGELFATLVGLLAVFIVIYRKSFFVYLGAILVLCIMIAAVVFEVGPFADIGQQWGFSPFGMLSERAELTKAAMISAHSYFPFGSGLGTYGGAGAQKFDLSYFDALGFNKFWWYRQGLFLVDTYWPNIIAESGFIAAALLALASILLVFYLAGRLALDEHTPRAFLAKMALASYLLLLVNTPSSAIITDPRGAFFIFLIVGAAMSRNKSKYNEKIQ